MICEHCRKQFLVYSKGSTCDLFPFLELTKSDKKDGEMISIWLCNSCIDKLEQQSADMVMSFIKAKKRET